MLKSINPYQYIEFYSNTTGFILFFSISRFVFTFLESEKPGFHILIWAMPLCTPNFHGHPLSPCVVSSPSIGSDSRARSPRVPYLPQPCQQAAPFPWDHVLFCVGSAHRLALGQNLSSPTWASHLVQALPIHGCHLHAAWALTHQACPHPPGSLFTLQVPPPTRPLLYTRPTLLCLTCLLVAWTGRGGKKMERENIELLDSFFF